MKGGSSDKYKWLNIPGIITPDTGSKEWYDQQIEEFGYTHVEPIIYNLPESEHRHYEEREFEDKVQLVSSFWSIRKNLDSLLGMCEKDAYTFYSQYMGKPIGKGRAALSMDMVRTYDNLDSYRIRYTFMTADTASTTATYSDYSVACYWGVTRCNKLVLLDVIIDKWEIPDLIPAMRNFWKLHNVFNPSKPTFKPRAFYIEDKSSGLHLNQQFLRDGTVKVKPVPRDGSANNDKFTRFLATIPYFKAGDILIPRDHEHKGYIIRELLGQSEFGSATGHDDVADNFSDAVAIAFAQGFMSYESWS
jgi:predicted phage terminase large subunit-like protein